MTPWWVKLALDWPLRLRVDVVTEFCVEVKGSAGWSVKHEQ